MRNENNKPIPGIESGMPSRGAMKKHLRAFLSAYYPETCGDVPAFDCNPCEALELGRVRSAGFIAADYVFANNDPTNPANWTAGINSKQIFIYPQTHGEVSDPSPKTGPGFGATIETLLAYEFNASIFIPNYQSNWAHFNQIKNNRNFLFFYATETQLHISDVPVVIIPGAKVDDDLTSLVNWNVKTKWQSPNLVEPIAIPAGLFDECYEPGE